MYVCMYMPCSDTAAIAMERDVWTATEEVYVDSPAPSLFLPHGRRINQVYRNTQIRFKNTRPLGVSRGQRITTKIKLPGNRIAICPLAFCLLPLAYPSPHGAPCCVCAGLSKQVPETPAKIYALFSLSAFLETKMLFYKVQKLLYRVQYTYPSFPHIYLHPHFLQYSFEHPGQRF